MGLKSVSAAGRYDSGLKFYTRTERHLLTEARRLGRARLSIIFQMRRSLSLTLAVINRKIDSLLNQKNNVEGDLQNKALGSSVGSKICGFAQKRKPQSIFSSQWKAEGLANDSTLSCQSLGTRV